MERSGTSWGTLKEVWDRSRDPRGGPGRVGGPSGRCGTGRRLLGRSRMGQGTLGEVRDWMGRSGTVRGTLGAV